MICRHFTRQLTYCSSILWKITHNNPVRWSHTNSSLTLQYKNDLAIIHMDNKMDNRFNSTFIKEINALLDSVEGNSLCKGLITVGAGKFYSNGIDLEWIKTISAQEVINFLADFRKMILRILILPIPTLAVINGHAFAGGAVLALAHDLRTMNSEKGWICFNEVLLNKVFSSFLLEFLRIKLGNGTNVTEALVLAQRYSAEDALVNGLVHSIEPSFQLFNHSLQVLESLVRTNNYLRQGLLNMKKDIYKLPMRYFEEEATERPSNFDIQFMNDVQLSSLKERS